MTGNDPKPPLGEPPEERPSLKVEDRRHWARRMAEEENADLPEAEPAAEREAPASAAGAGLIDAYRARAEEAEGKLHDYIAAFRQSQAEADAFRQRLTRDADRKVELRFADLVRDLLGTLDDLERSLSHVSGVAQAEPLAQGVALAIRGFLATLERHGIARIAPDGEPFDPEVAEAVRVDAVKEAELDGKVTETLRTGYRLGDQLVRPAAVAVGRRVRS